MTSNQMHNIVRSQLAIDLNCTPADFDQDGILFFEAQNHPNRRPFPRGERVFEMLTLGKAIIVSASPDILPYLRRQLENKTRDEAFSQPFVCGHSLYYLPDLSLLKPLELPHGFETQWHERQDMPRLYNEKGFQNAISYDLNHPRPDVLAVTATRDGTVVGMAGASADCGALWQVGIDVLPSCRGQGIAAALVSMITLEILRRGYIPYYGTSPANIPSQRVAHRSGYAIAWMSTYMGRFDGTGTMPTG